MEGVASGCVGVAVRMYVWEIRDGFLVAWASWGVLHAEDRGFLGYALACGWPVASPFHSFVMTVVVMRMTKCIATSRERQNALN